MLKKAAAEELINAIRVVAAGGVYLDPSLAGKVVGGYLNNRRVGGKPQRNDLSERELEVLRLVAWGYTNKEVAAYLRISVKTVETHKANIMQKLDLKSRVEQSEPRVKVVPFAELAKHVSPDMPRISPEARQAQMERRLVSVYRRRFSDF